MTVATASRPSMYQFRIDAKEKTETFEILDNMGMKPSQAVRLFFRQIRQTKTIPFPIEHIPNQDTRQTLDDMNAGMGITTYGQKEDLYSHLRTLAKQHA